MNSVALQDILNAYKGKQLFVAIHAPQGSGKTTLSKYLYNSLSDRGYNVLVMSLDDFYYPYDMAFAKTILLSFQRLFSCVALQLQASLPLILLAGVSCLVLVDVAIFHVRLVHLFDIAPASLRLVFAYA